MGQISMSTSRDQTAANRWVKAFLTTFVWASRSENAFVAVILAVKDVFEMFLGAHNGVYGASRVILLCCRASHIGKNALLLQNYLSLSTHTHTHTHQTLTSCGGTSGGCVFGDEETRVH